MTFASSRIFRQAQLSCKERNILNNSFSILFLLLPKSLLGKLKLYSNSLKPCHFWTHTIEISFETSVDIKRFLIKSVELCFQFLFLTTFYSGYGCTYMSKNTSIYIPFPQSTWRQCRGLHSSAARHSRYCWSLNISVKFISYYLDFKDSVENLVSKIFKFDPSEPCHFTQLILN
jgi:hypothetical protein